MLSITNAQGRIKKLNARIEFEGDESRHAADCSIEFQIGAGSEEVLKSLGYPELASMYGKDSRPIVDGLDFKIREKLHHIEATIRPKGAQGKDKAVTLECDVGGLTISPIRNIGLDMKCKVQARMTTAKFGQLWDMWCDGDVVIFIKAKQLDLKDGGQVEAKLDDKKPAAKTKAADKKPAKAPAKDKGKAKEKKPKAPAKPKSKAAPTAPPAEAAQEGASA